jgi:hypothetical protein
MQLSMYSGDTQPPTALKGQPTHNIKEVICCQLFFYLIFKVFSLFFRRFFHSRFDFFDTAFHKKIRTFRFCQTVFSVKFCRCENP